MSKGWKNRSTCCQKRRHVERQHSTCRSNVRHVASTCCWCGRGFRFIGKLVIDFLFVLIELFFARCYGWGAASKYWLEIGVFEGGWSVSAIFSRNRKRPPRTIFARIDRPVNTLQLCRWRHSHKNFLEVKCNLRRIKADCVSEPSFRGVRGNVRCSS